MVSVDKCNEVIQHFRWVCTSGFPEDLEESDEIATDVLETIMKQDSKFQVNLIPRVFRLAEVPRCKVRLSHV